MRVQTRKDAHANLDALSEDALGVQLVHVGNEVSRLGVGRDLRVVLASYDVLLGRLGRGNQSDGANGLHTRYIQNLFGILKGLLSNQSYSRTCDGALTSAFYARDDDVNTAL